MPLDRMAAQSAAHKSWAHTTDYAARTAPARAARDKRFTDQARELLGAGATERQVARSAESLRKAFYIDMSRKSAAARKRAA